MSSLSMTTRRDARPKKWRPMWHVRKDETGKLRFVPIRDKTEKRVGGTVYATVTSAVAKSPGKTRDLAMKIAAAGGAVSGLAGRMVSVVVGPDAVEAVGEAFESFGCQWDFEKGV